MYVIILSSTGFRESGKDIDKEDTDMMDTANLADPSRTPRKGMKSIQFGKIIQDYLRTILEPHQIGSEEGL